MSKMSLELNKKFRIRNLLEEREEYVDPYKLPENKSFGYTHVKKKHFAQRLISTQASLVAPAIKESTGNVGDPSSIPASGR